MKKAGILLVAVVLSGCNTVDYVGNFVKGYCENMSEVQRGALRETVAAATYPHRVVVECK